MEIEPSFIKGCFVIKPKEIKDSRGSFFETFTKKKFYEVTGLRTDFVQDNQSISKKGVLRGLHFQKGTHAQAKLVRVISGEVLDVVVDLRFNSETYGKHFSIVLNDKNNFQLFIPRGFAHGFITLSKHSVFSYKCDNYYHKSAESGIIYNDPKLNINWRLDDSEIQLSEKDRELSFFKNIDVQDV
ncbi:dTDP-4-dehydrorhamnose 3,5-epimerase [Aquimarina sp. AD10]|uniref:dTDP-4-dehydrorhamnose 3,5-epimerase n=1 Tax=Aquimarina sp. AD10 TaxID=1714849 RepID=UPI000E520738|nr:dTDP-4-dehydrorhamnose 3,5-epimerase [Aquimarina sp. AD10]AXT61840.1 dTDP-4-dehydrorhamnose 3,5-epimerase [Aquimarina sp. AD10]RKN02638.1 dTDP-4-dehydrorhamnose 3,5-epimerase [Aquimarina sp. AD10]